MTWTLHVEEEFSSAHANGPPGHKCNNVHGHDWLAVVEITYSKVDDNGWGPDFGAVKALIKPLDHKDLNEHFYPMKPSAELIAQWLYREVMSVTGLQPDFVDIHEGGANRVRYTQARP